MTNPRNPATWNSLWSVANHLRKAIEEQGWEGRATDQLERQLARVLDRIGKGETHDPPF